MLNLSVNFHENVIYRNSRINGEWGVKEREENLYDTKEDTLNPIESGKQFNDVAVLKHLSEQMSFYDYKWK